MNRIELLLIVLVLTVGTIFLIKSKWFDRFINNLLQGSKSTTAKELAQESDRVAQDVKARVKALAKYETDLKKEKSSLREI
jgi:hypothetical protein